MTHHHTAHGLRQKLGKEWGNYEPFALVRNPFDRAVSLYYGRYKNNLTPSPAGFPKFMRRIRNKHSYRWNPWYKLSSRITYDTRTFRLEDIEDCMDWLRSKGLTVKETPHVKTGKHRYLERLHYSAYYTPELVEEMTEAHLSDLQRWGWKFECPD